MQKNRNNNIGMLHILGAMFVLYGHHCAILGQSIPVLLNTQIQAIGVKMIFLISGYLITKSLWSIQKTSRRKTAVIYCIKRFGRLYPEYIACILICAFVVGPIFSSMDWMQYWANIPSVKFFVVRNVLLYPIFSLPGVFENNIYPHAVNGSFWTMPVEVALYMLVLVIFLLSKKDAVKKWIYTIITVCVIVIFTIRFYLYPNASLVIYGTDWLSALNLMPYFFVGGLACLYDWKKFFHIQYTVIAFLMFGGSIVLVPKVVGEVLSLVVLAYGVLTLAFAEEQKLVLKGVRSEYAYGIYLYGFVVQQCISQWFFTGRTVNFWNFHISFFFCALITYVLAMGSFEFIYKPANKLNKMMLNKLKES